MNSDHPIDMWEEGKDRWAYFGAGGNRKWPELVAAARAELVPQGFVEDRSRLPWICFTKDHYEVVLTDHQAFAVNATGMFKGKLIRRAGATPNEWPCVLVKNGPGTSGPMTAYQLKKLVLRW